MYLFHPPLFYRDNLQSKQRHLKIQRQFKHMRAKYVYLMILHLRYLTLDIFQHHVFTWNITSPKMWIIYSIYILIFTLLNKNIVLCNNINYWYYNRCYPYTNKKEYNKILNIFINILSLCTTYFYACICW